MLTSSPAPRQITEKWYQGRRGGLFLLLLGIALTLVFAALEWRLPAEAALERQTARVAWVRADPRQDALYFALEGQPRQFVLESKGDPDGRLRAAVRHASGLYPVTLRYRRDQSRRPGFLPGEFIVAYALAVGGKDVASYAEVRASYRRDNLVALAMGLGFAAAGAWRLRQLRQRPASGRRAGGGTPGSRRSR